MNRKSNPWVALVALLLMLVLVVCTCAGCTYTTEAAAEPENPRFLVEDASAQRAGSQWSVDVYIITDTETGVQYLFVRASNAGGLTVLEPATEKEDNQ